MESKTQKVEIYCTTTYEFLEEVENFIKSDVKENTTLLVVEWNYLKKTFILSTPNKIIVEESYKNLLKERYDKPVKSEREVDFSEKERKMLDSEGF